MAFACHTSNNEEAVKFKLPFFASLLSGLSACSAASTSPAHLQPVAPAPPPKDDGQPSQGGNGGAQHAAALEQLQTDFETLYEQRFGPGSSYRAAGIELVTFRLKARGLLPRPRIAPEPLGAADPSAAERGRRAILFVDAADWTPTTVYDFARLMPGNVVRGPTVVHSPVTTIVVQNGRVARLDGFRNLILESA